MSERSHDRGHAELPSRPDGSGRDEVASPHVQHLRVAASFGDRRGDDGRIEGGSADARAPVCVTAEARNDLRDERREQQPVPRRDSQRPNVNTAVLERLEVRRRSQAVGQPVGGPVVDAVRENS